MAGRFQTEYTFEENAVVILRHQRNRQLRVRANGDGLAANGGTGKWARWEMELEGDDIVKLKHATTGKYLRIFNDDNLDCGGSGGKWTRFQLHREDDGSVKFESCECPGKFPAVQPRGVAIGGGGKWTKFNVFCSENDADDEEEEDPEEEEEEEVIEEAVEEEPADPEPEEEAPAEPEPEEEAPAEPEPEPEEEPAADPEPEEEPPADPEPEEEPAADPEPEEEPPADPEPEEEAPAEPEPEEEPPAEPAEEEPAEPEEEEPAEPAEEEEEKEPAEIPEEEQHDQPFPGPRPSISGAEEFNDEIAAAAADTLRKSMKGMGTNERKIVVVTNSYSHSQRMAIKAAYHENYERDLLKDFRKELGGKFEKMVLGFWRDSGGYDAYLVAEACSGMGTNEEVLTEVICTRTPSQLNAMQSAWTKDTPLIERVRSETGDGSYGTLLASILEGKRAPNGPVDEERAKADAELLNRMLTQESKADAKAKFVEVFASRSWVQIREISGVFSDIAKKYTMAGAIEETFGDGDTATALQTINSFASQPYDFWAQKLRDALKGMGTDDERLRRVIISRAEIDLRDIGVTFGNRYGDGKTLAKWIKDDCSGDYEKLLLAVCGLS